MKETWAKAAAAAASQTHDAFIEAVKTVQPTPAENAKRLFEIAEELEEMASGYLEKAALLHHEAARTRVAAVALAASEGKK